MFWMTWRQHRRPALVWLAGLVLLAAVLVPTGLAMRHTFERLGLDRCTRAVDGRMVTRMEVDGCPEALTLFRDQYAVYALAALLLVALPLLFGLFWGPALVSAETEHGTHRLVWTQGISRRRWAAVKFGLVGAVVTVPAIAYALGMAWWFEPLHRAGDGRFGELAFDVQGTASIGHTLFAVGLGLLAGTLLRRTGPAMALTLAGYLAVRVVVARWLRPHYLRPHLVVAARRESVDKVVAPDDWTIVSAIKDAAGHVIHSNGSVSCAPAPAPCFDYGPGTYNWVLFQPAGRYWTFQWIETGIFAGLAVLVVLAALRRLSRIS
jgi:hypothetical protein